MRRRILTAEEMYNNLTDDIQYVFEQLASEHYRGAADDMSPQAMLQYIMEQSLRWKAQYEKQVQNAQDSLNYNFETIAMFLRKAGDE